LRSQSELQPSARQTIRFDRLADLTEPAALSSLLGPVDSLELLPFVQLGHSGATFERVHIRLQSEGRIALVIKRVQPALNWTAFRTRDAVGREMQLLQEPTLAGVWTAFVNPYVAYAAAPGQVGLLMEDLSDHVRPDMDVPDQQSIPVQDEDGLLAALAGLHARYWQSDTTALPWLLQPWVLFSIMGPHAPAPPNESLRPLLHQVTRGWRAALARVPRSVAELLIQPPDVLARRCQGLPLTLLHGDAKIANFAVLPSGRAAAFDWAWVGAGPATLDLGWYLAHNAGHLARPRDAVLARYRHLLEAALGSSLPGGMWEQMVQVGLLCGALMLLWQKALALELEETPSPLAEADWQWWVDALVRLC
jgi:hypothetical protein